MLSYYRKDKELKTCENCEYSVVFDRSLSRRDLGNLGCGWLNNELNVQEEVPQVEPDHTCHYWQPKDEANDVIAEEIVSVPDNLIHPWGAE